MKEGRENVAEFKNGYEKIGPTAWGVAYARTLSDIPYAKEVFAEFEKLVNQTEKDTDYMESARRSRMEPFFEARFKLTNRLLKNDAAKQILEIAAGLSPRGLAMAKTEPTLQYVELDLPEMARLKKDIAARLAKNGTATPPNLSFKEGDALDKNSLLAAVHDFKNKPIAVINEGLMRYLSFEQKARYADNVRLLLEKFGGVWITPDITISIGTGSQHSIERIREIRELADIDVGKNYFRDERQARMFFEDLGFNVERHSLNEVKNELVSPARIGMPKKEVDDLLTRVAFVMKLKS